MIKLEDKSNDLIEKIEQEIKNVTNEGIKMQDLEILSKLVDIHKDLENEEYWKVKKEAIEMRYNRGYGEYGDYESYGEYGRRGVPGTGRGDYRRKNRLLFYDRAVSPCGLYF